MIHKSGRKSMKFSPKGKPFKKRINAFIVDAKSTHNVTVRVDKGRTAKWQQKHHVGHMFLYNKYRSTTPRKVEKGKRTIAWSHVSDPGIIWKLIKWEDFLRTKNGEVPEKDGKKWKAGKEPDKNRTYKNVLSMQRKGGIGNNGKAMVSSGLRPCDEPCRCKAGRSKHIGGFANDANSRDLIKLSKALTKAKAGSLDDYLKKFGLHRPLLKHPKSPEKWHIEATKK